jgi:tRNA nucleotidyltransferase (CCA-adding enzyme)
MYNASLEILKKINDNGFKAYVVGGYVRDLYLNKRSMDVDICTNATPKQLKEIFGNLMLPKESYGSVTIRYKKIRFEVTTFRKDIKYENHRAPIKIKYIDSLIDDLKRRDFTINTLCMDEYGEIIDLLGAREDLDNKLIKVVGSPKKKLKEDVLRILRAIRFATTLNFTLDDSVKKYIKKYGYLLESLSYERKKEELEKIFTSKNASYGVNLMMELGIDKYLELHNLDKLVIVPSLIGIWSQLGVIDTYPFSNDDKVTIKKLNELQNLDLYDSMVLYKYGLYNCSIVGQIRNIPKKLITKKYNDLVIHNISDLDINGKDIQEVLNIKGKEIGNILHDIEVLVLKKELENDKEVIKKYMVEKYSNIQNNKNDI